MINSIILFWLLKNIKKYLALEVYDILDNEVYESSINMTDDETLED